MRTLQHRPRDLRVRAWQLIVLGFLPSCASAGQSTRTPARERATAVFRVISYTDSELAARGLGRMEIVIRSADRPTQTLVGAAVMVSTPGGESLRRSGSERDPVMRLDSLPIGQYQVRALAMGYAPETFVVTVTAGCRTDVELYIGLDFVGIAPPPPMPARATITTCRPGQ